VQSFFWGLSFSFMMITLFGYGVDMSSGSSL
jgi:hypothetical protein